MEQEDISDYVALVQPCIERDAGHDLCTDGAIYREDYTDLPTSLQPY